MRATVPPSPERLIRFDAFEVDVRTGELRKHGAKVKLADQPFSVLALLLAQPGEVVTRDELQRTRWPADTFVDFDRGLNKAINRLRDALGDSCRRPRRTAGAEASRTRLDRGSDRRSGGSRPGMVVVGCKPSDTHRRGAADQILAAPARIEPSFRTASRCLGCWHRLESSVPPSSVISTTSHPMADSSSA